MGYECARRVKSLEWVWFLNRALLKRNKTCVIRGGEFGLEQQLSSMIDLLALKFGRQINFLVSMKLYENRMKMSTVEHGAVLCWQTSTVLGFSHTSSSRLDISVIYIERHEKGGGTSIRFREDKINLVGIVVNWQDLIEVLQSMAPCKNAWLDIQPHLAELTSSIVWGNIHNRLLQVSISCLLENYKCAYL